VRRLGDKGPSSEIDRATLESYYEKALNESNETNEENRRIELETTRLAEQIRAVHGRHKVAKLLDSGTIYERNNLKAIYADDTACGHSSNENKTVWMKLGEAFKKDRDGNPIISTQNSNDITLQVDPKQPGVA
jgi:hypothetical protein